MSSGQPQSNVGNTPVPDPTVLTTQQLLREINALEKTIGTRIEGMDRALELREREAKLVAAANTSQVEHLKELLLAMMDERQRAIEIQFEERDTRAKGDAVQVKEAVAAALQAQKEAASEAANSTEKAIGKSEAAFAKQIDALGERLTIAAEGLDRRINDLKEAVTRIESAGIGRASQVTEHRAQSGDIRGVILMCVAILGAAITAAAFIIANS